MTMLHYQGKDHFLVAAEKTDKCLLFDLDGNQEDVVWEEPGGVMTMQQVPGTDGQFLSTHKFYSPNDSKDAKIVIVTPKGKGDWEVRTLVELPFIHRFDILERNGVRYLIACALKSDHEYKEDWRFPGKVYAAVLPEDLSGFDADHQLELTVLKDNMLKNHGYCKTVDGGVETSIISADCGVFQFIPPASPEGDWEIRELLSEAASDAVLVDFDGDGEKELGVLSPFHGEKISIYKKKDGKFEKVYAYEKDAEFTHAIFGGMLCGKPTFVVGHRKGARELLAFTYDPATKSYKVQVLDTDCGPANVLHYTKEGKDILISTNREIDEVAMYTLE
jgi:hypothetical protein